MFSNQFAGRCHFIVCIHFPLHWNVFVVRWLSCHLVYLISIYILVLFATWQLDYSPPNQPVVFRRLYVKKLDICVDNLIALKTRASELLLYMLVAISTVGSFLSSYNGNNFMRRRSSWENEELRTWRIRAFVTILSKDNVKEYNNTGQEKNSFSIRKFHLLPI